MEWTGLNQLREQYLSFFESKGHTRMDSASLIPKGDNSLLLINSGMAPLKKFFLGQAVPPNVRVTTCQKCIRTPDIERVGKTARHGTFFEMLGNFSFGEYFKREAIGWAWEFLTGTLAIPADRLWITIFESDDEAEQIWEKEIGIPHDRIIRLGKADNFWEHGSGPCGPCSEIHFDRGEAYGPFESFEQASDCDRIIEIWNLVFSQFDSDGKGNYAEMKHKNIDTGMGLERLACVMQGVDNLFEVDTVQNIMQHICKIAGIAYHTDEKKDVSLRVITDHIRSTVFMVGDGITPANDGRGYVLKRLLRRAARHGRLLGIKEPFLYQVAETVIRENETAYPELKEKQELIIRIIRHEEESFARTIDNGTDRLNDMIAALKAESKTVLAGKDAFTLSDTYGFPIDLTIEMAEEQGISVDEEGFRACMEEQKQRARADRASKVKTSWGGDITAPKGTPNTEFTGYTSESESASVLAILCDGQAVETLEAGKDAVIVLDRTPFYAESGGQVGDTGEIAVYAEGEAEVTFAVADTRKDGDGHFLHMGTLELGTLRVGDTVTAAIDADRRHAVMRNHTAAHLLQAALRSVLGDHVHQAGQLVDADRCRFDFSHFSGVSAEELAKVEQKINAAILGAEPVTTQEMPIEDAKKLGAMALFGEKYGDVVRVVTAGSDSIEFCGGTHVSNTAQIGLCKIVSESSVAAGVRRIELLTGANVLKLIAQTEQTFADAARALKLANPAELPEKCAALSNELREKTREIEKLNQKIANSQLADLFTGAEEIGGMKVVTAKLSDVKPDMLRKLGDQIRDKESDVIALLAGVSGAGGNLYCVCSKSAAAKGAHAGNIIRQTAAATGGKGGGKPDSAMGGIGDSTKVDAALSMLAAIVKEQLNA
ncbi:MAG: alanine--tRNA ligase [Oscillospiraceae bacterium]|nr:alanine--tRNA ligase [Oscillospiraceae bacterium]